MKTVIAAALATVAAASLAVATRADAQDARHASIAGAPVVVLPVAARVVDTRIGDQLPMRIDAPLRPTWRDLVAVVNVAVVAPDEAGYVTFWNCEGEPPEVAHLNYNAGGVTSGMAYAPLSADGTMCAVATGGGDLVVDLQAWTAAGSVYYF